MGAVGVEPEGHETLDRPAWVEPAALAQNLDDLAAIKRWLGYDLGLYALGAPPPLWRYVPHLRRLIPYCSRALPEPTEGAQGAS